MDSLRLHGAIGPSGVQLLLAIPRPLRIPARHVSHARVSGVLPVCYAAGNEWLQRKFAMSPQVAWRAARSRPRAVKTPVSKGFRAVSRFCNAGCTCPGDKTPHTRPHEAAERPPGANGTQDTVS